MWQAFGKCFHTAQRRHGENILKRNTTSTPLQGMVLLICLTFWFALTMSGWDALSNRTTPRPGGPATLLSGWALGLESRSVAEEEDAIGTQCELM
jgi:hypothetical protein